MWARSVSDSERKERLRCALANWAVAFGPRRKKRAVEPREEREGKPSGPTPLQGCAKGRRESWAEREKAEQERGSGPSGRKPE